MSPVVQPLVQTQATGVMPQLAGRQLLHIAQSEDVINLTAVRTPAIEALGGPLKGGDVISMGGILQDLQPAAENPWRYETQELLRSTIELVWVDKKDKLRYIDQIKDRLRREDLEGIVLWFDRHRDGYGHYMAAQVVRIIRDVRPDLAGEVYRVVTDPCGSRKLSGSPPASSGDEPRSDCQRPVKYFSTANREARRTADAMFFRDDVRCRVSWILSGIQREAIKTVFPKFEINLFPSVPFGPDMSFILYLILVRYKNYIERHETELYNDALLERDLKPDLIALNTREKFIQKMIASRYIHVVQDGRYVPSQLGATLAEWYHKIVPDEGLLTWNHEVGTYMDQIKAGDLTRDEALSVFLSSKFGTDLVDPAFKEVKDLLDKLCNLQVESLFDPLPLDRI